MPRPRSKEERRKRNAHAVGLAIAAVTQVRNYVPVELAKGLLTTLSNVLMLFQVRFYFNIGSLVCDAVANRAHCRTKRILT